MGSLLTYLNVPVEWAHARPSLSKIVASAKRGGEESIKTYERMLEDLAQAQESAGSRGAEWIQEFTRAQAAFTRQLAVAFPSFLERLGQRGRDLVGTATATARSGAEKADDAVRGEQK